MKRATERELFDRLDRVERIIDHVDRSVEKIEVATIVRDPSSKLSVDAYDGLRKQIVGAASERVAHLVQLVEFAEAMVTASPADLERLVEQWMSQAGLVRFDDPTDDRVFDVLGGEGPVRVVLRPAYIDSITGRPIRMGQAELSYGTSTNHTPSPAEAEVAPPEPQDFDPTPPALPTDLTPIPEEGP